MSFLDAEGSYALVRASLPAFEVGVYSGEASAKQTNSNEIRSRFGESEGVDGWVDGKGGKPECRESSNFKSRALVEAAVSRVGQAEVQWM